MGEALALIRAAFADMDGRVDPPSSVHRLTRAALQSDPSEVWTIGTPVTACAVFTPAADHLYIGKVAVAPAARGTGQTRALIAAADTRARTLSLPRLMLQCRIELTDNHAIFTRLGFAKVAETAHAGYDRPTSLTFAKDVT